MDGHKLFRKPLTDPKWSDPREVSVAASQDGKFKVAFSHFSEARMMLYLGLFNLLDSGDNIVDSFEPLVTFSNNKCCWNEASTLLALAIVDFGYGYLLREVAFIKAPDPFPH